MRQRGKWNTGATVFERAPRSLPGKGSAAPIPPAKDALKTPGDAIALLYRGMRTRVDTFLVDARNLMTAHLGAAARRTSLTERRSRLGKRKAGRHGAAQR